MLTDAATRLAGASCPDCYFRGERVREYQDCKRCTGSGYFFPESTGVRVVCPGYEYYGHEPLDIDGYYDTCEYVERKGFDDVPLDEVEVDINGPDNLKVIALVRQALQRDDPLDDWLDEQLNAAHVGDTANRECAYLTVMTNLPHPPCQGRGWTAATDGWVWMREATVINLTLMPSGWVGQVCLGNPSFILSDSMDDPETAFFAALERAVEAAGGTGLKS